MKLALALAVGDNQKAGIEKPLALQRKYVEGGILSHLPKPTLYHVCVRVRFIPPFFLI